jgi:hypothetical protein
MSIYFQSQLSSSDSHNIRQQSSDNSSDITTYLGYAFPELSLRDSPILRAVSKDAVL